LPPPLRRLADALAMAVMAVFAATVAFFLWKLVAASYAIGATGHSIIQTPQWVPQACAALGYTFLSFVALTGLLAQLLGADDALAGEPGS
jgi:TRAP-type C4-dicarboxylate transport system permease small subunit